MSEEEIVKEGLNKVLYVEKKERKDETFTSALRKRLEEVKEIGDTGYAREVLITVPKDIVETNPQARKFIKLAGEILRDKKCNMEVAMEPKSVQVSEDENVNVLDFVFKVTPDTDITYIIENHLV